jgi:hypothetical protein
MSDLISHLGNAQTGLDQQGLMIHAARGAGPLSSAPIALQLHNELLLLPLVTKRVAMCAGGGLLLQNIDQMIRHLGFAMYLLKANS